MTERVMIKVKFLANLSDQVGIREIQLITENDIYKTIKQIEIEVGYPLTKNLENQVGLLINGTAYQHYIRNKACLQDGDILAVVPILGAG